MENLEKTSEAPERTIKRRRRHVEDFSKLDIGKPAPKLREYDFPYKKVVRRNRNLVPAPQNNETVELGEVQQGSGDVCETSETTDPAQSKKRVLTSIRIC